MQSNSEAIRYKGMKKRKRSNKPSSAKTRIASGKAIMTRRNALRLLVAVPFVGTVGAAIHKWDVDTRERHDLSVIGTGTPAIVQIHDPSCQPCRRLMANTKKAIDGGDSVLYRIADITTREGKQFQLKHNGQKVTLLLFNSKGRLVDTVRGVTPVENLKHRFASISTT